MKTLRFISCLIAVVCGMMSASAESRFFKANSVRIKYVYSDYYEIPIPPPPDWHEPELDYYPAEMWTGNDTIVDGYQCVTLWDKDEGEEPCCIGCIREDEDGLVWRYEIRSKFIETVYPKLFNRIQYNWIFLYDFSNQDWKVGTRLNVGDLSTLGPVERRIYNLDKMTLHNGEEVPIANRKYIYGLGNLQFLFEGESVSTYSLYECHVLEYWRDGVLLIKNESPETAVNGIEASPTPSPYLYDLQGRPVDGTQKGILIRNGKKVLVK